MSFNHKEDCKFKGFVTRLMSRDSNGPDSELEIVEHGISFNYTECTVNKEDWYLEFNFCPLCGVPKDK